MLKILILNVLLIVPGVAAVSVPLTIQEELPIGTTGCSTAAACGVARSNEPFTQGVPLPDSASTGTNTTSTLGLAGCSAGQFRVLETWPSGNIKWVEVSGIVGSVAAGGTANCTLVSTGSGNFPSGSNLATDNGSTITVATGTSTYTIKKANFNLIDSATVGTTPIVTSSSAATRGLVLNGPASPATDCSGGCATAFSSANDASSSCTIEENGPVKAVVKCTGDLVDGSGHVYLHHTTRETFWKNKDEVKVVNSLRNADKNTSSFNTAYKGFASYVAQVDLASSGGAGTNKYSFGGKAGTVGPTTFSGSENAQLVQLYSNRLEGGGIGTWNTSINIADNTTQSIIPRSEGGGCTDAFCYPDATRSAEGYTIKDGATTVESGTRSDYPVGWCDTDNASGAGVMAGGWYFGAYWPKSCELNNGGSTVTYGIWPSQISGFNYWIAWPQYQTHTFYLQFHSAALSSPTTTFLSLQYPLIARFGVAQLNASGVLPQGMVLPDPAAEDSFYQGIADRYGFSRSYACCVTDTSADANAQTTRIYSWGQGSADNQSDLRWAGMILFQTRGFTSRYTKSEMFERYVMDNALPRSDFAGGWRGAGGALTMIGFPADASTNSDKSLRSWIDALHAHNYGIFDYYGLTGDEAVKDAISQGFYDWLTNTSLTAYFNSGPQRAIGVLLMMEQHLHDFALGIGDSAMASTAWSVAEQAMNAARQVMNTYDSTRVGNPCLQANCAGPHDSGTDPSRGVTFFAGSGTNWDNPPATGSGNPIGSGTSRNSGQLQEGILEEGMTEYLLARGPSFATYESDRDLILGNSFFVKNEWMVTGQSPQLKNGTRAGAALDYCNDPAAPCSAGTHNTWAVYFAPNAEYYTWIPFSIWYGDNSWTQSFIDNLYQNYSSTGCANMSECGIYSMASAVYRALNPPAALGDITPTNFVDNGGGSYTVSWTVPAGANGYLFKWGSHPISYNLGFDNGQTMTFALSPAANTTWWAANNVSNEPAPAASGTTQSYTFVTGVSGLTASCFSLKAVLTGGGGGGGGTGTASRLLSISGNGQTGTSGHALGSPFTVEVTDASGNPVSGIGVTFTVAGGGGALSATSVTTNGSGLASTVLTLGPAAGSNAVTASSGSLTGSPITFTATATSAPSGPANLTLVSGNGQAGTVGQTLPSPFTVKVTDASGNPVGGVTVTFAVTSGGASLSALSVPTNSAGMASTLLTLGPAPGANTITATSGALQGSPVIFTAAGTSGATGSGAITWINQPPTPGWPQYVGWLALPFDPVSQQTLMYIGPPTGSHGIYSTDLYAYSASTNTFTRISGTQSAVDACPLDTPTQPGDRHPLWQMAIDTKRNLLWIYGGLNQTCSAPSGPDANPRQDMYYLALNPNPATDTWHQVTPAHIPAANGYAAMVYDPDDDVLFAFGSDGSSLTHTNWVYCRTAENPVPGTLTSKQSAAGCASPDDWSLVSVAGGVQPPGVAFPGMVYDTVTKKVIQYGGMNGGLATAYNQTWAYDVPTKTWTRKALSTSAPPAYNGSYSAQPALAYNSKTNKVLFHQTSNTGAPADWQYDPVADTWTLVSSAGGSTTDQVMTYDSANNVLIGYNLGASGNPEVWIGSFSSSGGGGGTGGPCDLNDDGVVNQTDIQIAINQTLGVNVCGNADLVGSGACTVVDVQRVVNAALGGACRTGN